MGRQFSQSEGGNEFMQLFYTSLVETTESSSQTTRKIAIKHDFEKNKFIYLINHTIETNY